jgi:aryl-alcohol dehydrogenase-like predicted oxidoreductase
MEYRNLGKAGVKVSPICLGAGVRGPLDESRLVRSIERAIELGCNFIDCANNYGKGQSEPILGRVIKGRRDELVITSKVFTRTGPGPNDGGLSRYHIMREVERSLKRLQTDRIDIYYMHNVDPDTGFAETLRTMEDLVRQGKVRYIGASNFGGAQVVELLWAAERLGLEPIVCLQNQYNLLHRRQLETDLLPVCRRFGLGLMTYSPLAVGLLSGRFRRRQEPPADGFWSREQLPSVLSERGDQVVQTLIDLAKERNATPAQMAIAWILDRPEVTAPITGADRPEYVDEIFGALAIKLTVEERRRLDEVSRWLEPGPYL